MTLDAFNDLAKADQERKLEFTPAMLSPKANRLQERFPHSGPGVKILDRFSLGSNNRYTVYENNGRYYMWLDTPLGAKVTNFKKNKAWMDQRINEMKQAIASKHSQRAEKELKGKRQMAEFIATKPSSETASLKIFLANEIGKDFLSNDEFIAFKELFEKTRTDNTTDQVLAAYITSEALKRGIDVVGPTTSIPLSRI